MKLDKRKCRKFAGSGLKMQPGNGILHADQVGYIVCTAVRTIDRHRTLVLYVCSRGKAAGGDFRPLWTVFQSRDDYITLERKEDGSTAWRKAAFDRLDGGWDFKSRCAFYSEQDEMRVRKYFRDGSGSGFKLLSGVQADIQSRRRKERQLNKEKQTVSRMSCLPALPRGLKGWIHKSVMPSYFFYDYRRSREITGVCSSCGKEIRFPGVKQGVRKVCPHCHKELVCKPRSRRGYSMCDRSTVQAIQSTGDGGLVVRIIKIYCSYRGTDVPETNIYENARFFVRTDSGNGGIRIESYYDSYGSGFLTGWKKGERPTFSPWQYSFEGDICGFLYTRNLPDALAGTPWQYCPIADFYGHFREPLQVLPFLAAHLEHPRMEHLVKTGFYRLVSDLVYRYGTDCLDETQRRTHRILQTAAEDVGFLRGLETDMKTLEIFQEYAGLKGRQELLLWQLEHKVGRDILPALQYMTPHKFMRYLDGQYGFLNLRRTPDGRQRYKNMQDLVSEYRDYLGMCSGLEYDMKNSFVLYPKDLQKSHDRAAKRHKQKESAIIRRNFAAVYRQAAGKLGFEKDGMKIVCPSTPADLDAEGRALHHCVGGYDERVAKRECIILFLRRCPDESTPYYTIEVRGRKAVQVRGMGNCDMTPEVRDFITAWEQRVLSRADIAV